MTSLNILLLVLIYIPVVLALAESHEQSPSYHFTELAGRHLPEIQMSDGSFSSLVFLAPTWLGCCSCCFHPGPQVLPSEPKRLHLGSVFFQKKACAFRIPPCLDPAPLYPQRTPLPWKQPDDSKRSRMCQIFNPVHTFRHKILGTKINRDKAGKRVESREHPVLFLHLSY